LWFSPPWPKPPPRPCCRARPRVHQRRHGGALDIATRCRPNFIAIIALTDSLEVGLIACPLRRPIRRGQFPLNPRKAWQIQPRSISQKWQILGMRRNGGTGGANSPPCTSFNPVRCPSSGTTVAAHFGRDAVSLHRSRGFRCWISAAGRIAVRADARLGLPSPGPTPRQNIARPDLMPQSGLVSTTGQPPPKTWLEKPSTWC